MKEKPQILIRGNEELVSEAGANFFLDSAKRNVKEKDRFNVAISGGNTPRSMHRLLARDPFRSQIPWEKVHLFWVDERCVPVSHPESNYGATKEDLLDRVPIPDEQVHPIICDHFFKESVQNYLNELKELFQLEKEGAPKFDQIFLGVGNDGHTASLFPGNKELKEQTALVVAVKGGDSNLPRLTLTLPVLNHAKEIVFLVTGKKKAQIVSSVLGDEYLDLPAQQVRPLTGVLKWVMDKEAASMLRQESNNEGI